jgi:hypothetical protein
MDPDCNFYICMTCFRVSESERSCHGHIMIHCDARGQDVEKRKPLMDNDGDLLGRAPVWFIEAQEDFQHEPKS